MQSRIFILEEKEKLQDFTGDFAYLAHCKHLVWRGLTHPNAKILLASSDYHITVSQHTRCRCTDLHVIFTWSRDTMLEYFAVLIQNQLPISTIIVGDTIYAVM